MSAGRTTALPSSAVALAQTVLSGMAGTKLAAGLFLLLIATEGEDTAKARRLWDRAARAVGSVPVAVGWSRDGFTIRELARELLALESVRSKRAEVTCS